MHRRTGGVADRKNAGNADRRLGAGRCPRRRLGRLCRQNPALLAAFPTGLRSQSARLLTDLLAADVSALEDTLTYLSTRPAPAVDYVTAETAKAKGGVCLTDAGMAAVRDLLS